MRISRERLLRRGDYVFGSFLKPETVDGYINAVNPGDRSDVLGRFPFSTRSVDDAIDYAQTGARSWRKVGLMDRGAAVRRFREALDTHGEPLARLLTRETGKPLWEARQEVAAALRAIELYLDDGIGLIAPRLIEEIGGRTDYLPRGVVGIVCPYTMPLLLAATTTAGAILGGNAVVLKPSKFTPGTGQAVAELWDRCKLPRGVFNLVQGSGSVIGQRLVAHPGLDALLFTGSYETAKDVRRAISDRPEMPVLLNCGGKGAAVVLDDAPIDRAVYEVIVGSLLSTGQRHNSTARVFVCSRVFDAFTYELQKRIQRVRIGFGEDDDIFMGPLISENFRLRFRKFSRLLTSKGHPALVEGDAVEIGGRRGNYVRPAVHRINWENGMPFLDEEPPGPTLLIYKVADLEEAARLHNKLAFRPVVSLFARGDGHQVAEARDLLRSGALNVNRSTVGSSMRLPAVGLGRSSNGLSGGLELMRVVTYPRASLIEQRPFDPANVVPGLDWDDQEDDTDDEPLLELAVE